MRRTQQRWILTVIFTVTFTVCSAVLGMMSGWLREPAWLTNRSGVFLAGAFLLVLAVAVGAAVMLAHMTRTPDVLLDDLAPTDFAPARLGSADLKEGEPGVFRILNQACGLALTAGDRPGAEAGFDHVNPNSRQQLWSMELTRSPGEVLFVSVCTGLVLDATTFDLDGKRLRGNYKSNAAGQRWLLTETSSGNVTIRTCLGRLHYEYMSLKEDARPNWDAPWFKGEMKNNDQLWELQMVEAPASP
jgi:hypothetical protein